MSPRLFRRSGYLAAWGLLIAGLGLAGPATAGDRAQRSQSPHADRHDRAGHHAGRDHTTRHHSRHHHRAARDHSRRWHHARSGRHHRLKHRSHAGRAAGGGLRIRIGDDDDDFQLGIRLRHSNTRIHRKATGIDHRSHRRFKYYKPRARARYELRHWRGGGYVKRYGRVYRDHDRPGVTIVRRRSVRPSGYHRFYRPGSSVTVIERGPVYDGTTLYRDDAYRYDLDYPQDYQTQREAPTGGERPAPETDARAIQARESWQHLGSGRPHEALQGFSLLCATWPRRAEPMVGYALAMADINNDRRAVPAMRKALKVDPAGVDRVPVSNELRRRLSVWAARYQRLAKQAEAEKEAADAWFMAGALNYLRGERKQASQMLAQIESQRQSPSTKHLRALIEPDDPS